MLYVVTLQNTQSNFAICDLEFIADARVSNGFLKFNILDFNTFHSLHMYRCVIHKYVFLIYENGVTFWEHELYIKGNMLRQ